MSGSSFILACYLIYVLVAMSLFALRTQRQAALIAYFGGWLLLPVAIYDPRTITAQGFTLDIIGTALPSDLLLTKALIIPLGILAGLAWRAPSLLRAFRPGLPDAFMAAFCLSPLLALLGGHIGPGSALVQSAYLAGVWGGSWIIGRVLLNDGGGHQALVRAIAASGLCLVPFALIEGWRGARVYTLLYGTHPFYADGTERYVGARPIAFLEHGNQYGLWICMGALAAFYLALRDETRSRRTVALALLIGGCAIASQSIGAIVLLGLGAIWLLLPGRVRRVSFIAGALLIGLGGAAYLSGALPLERVAYGTPMGRATIAALKSTGRGSLSWRVHRDIEALDTIHRAPLTGYGRWDWWRPLNAHPWGLTLLLAGQFGLISLALLACAMLADALRALWFGSLGVLPVIIVLAAIDAQLNSFIYFGAILAAAALAPRRRSAPLDAGPAPSPSSVPKASLHVP